MSAPQPPVDGIPQPPEGTRISPESASSYQKLQTEASEAARAYTVYQAERGEYERQKAVLEREGLLRKNKVYIRSDRDRTWYQKLQEQGSRVNVAAGRYEKEVSDYEILKSQFQRAGLIKDDQFIFKLERLEIPNTVSTAPQPVQAQAQTNTAIDVLGAFYEQNIRKPASGFVSQYIPEWMVAHTIVSTKITEGLLKTTSPVFPGASIGAKIVPGSPDFTKTTAQAITEFGTKESYIGMREDPVKQLAIEVGSLLAVGGAGKVARFGRLAPVISKSDEIVKGAQIVQRAGPSGVESAYKSATILPKLEKSDLFIKLGTAGTAGALVTEATRRVSMPTGTPDWFGKWEDPHGSIGKGELPSLPKETPSELPTGEPIGPDIAWRQEGETLQDYLRDSGRMWDGGRIIGPEPYYHGPEIIGGGRTVPSSELDVTDGWQIGRPEIVTDPLRWSPGTPERIISPDFLHPAELPVAPGIALPPDLSTHGGMNPYEGLPTIGAETISRGIGGGIWRGFGEISDRDEIIVDEEPRGIYKDLERRWSEIETDSLKKQKTQTKDDFTFDMDTASIMADVPKAPFTITTVPRQVTSTKPIDLVRPIDTSGSDSRHITGDIIDNLSKTIPSVKLSSISITLPEMDFQTPSISLTKTSSDVDATHRFDTDIVNRLRTDLPEDLAAINLFGTPTKTRRRREESRRTTKKKGKDIDILSWEVRNKVPKMEDIFGPTKPSKRSRSATTTNMADTAAEIRRITAINPYKSNKKGNKRR